MLVDFRGGGNVPFFDIRVFRPNAQSYRNTSIPSAYRRHEQQKKREYGDRVREVELASFTPLVFSTTGGMGKEAVTFYRRLAELLSRRNTMTYSSTLAWLRCLLSLLRSATMQGGGTPIVPLLRAATAVKVGQILDRPIIYVDS